MFQKLREVEHRFEELTEQMTDPSVQADPRRFATIAKEQSSLGPIVNAYREYRDATKALQEAQALQNDSDPDMRELAKAELAELTPRIAELEQKLEILLLPKDPMDDKNIFLEIRAGTGGEEAALFAADLFRMYSRYAERMGWNTEIAHLNETELRGLKEVIVQISGRQVYSILKYESGVHRVQRVPETEAQGRIHTSAVTVAILPEIDDVDVEVREEDIRVDVYRASGAGGQHVNKTDSAVRMTHIPTGIVVACQDERSQHKNRAKAMKILRAKIYEAQQEAIAREQRDARRAQVGSGDRSERIRTYNFPQNRVTDHRVGVTLYKLELIMEGDMEELLSSVRTFFQAELLKAARGESAA